MTNPEFVSLEISPSSGVPIYRQLMEQIRRMIASNQLSPGDGLPSVRQIATQLSVNPMTISKSYSLLEAEGLLERQRGKGMIVSKQNTTTRTLEERIDLLSPAIDELINEAKQLDINSEIVISELKKRLGD
ncbi:GntR family transcriptional regulator [Pleionea sediminis]|uniref:GntR family transcriptional regulator n=1 Tax=Pleionea sediminis TaxID=2569479 RepID=UPI0011851CEA|nr:GntR family transcriptional regulator [Pleionea sediminis]